jgi:chromosome partitioning protein
MIISFVNEKGGVGKTTLVTNVAACLSNRGHKVCLVDTDKQQASTVWYNNREKGDIFISNCTEPKALSKHLTQLIDQYDIVLVDGRPHIDEMLDRTMLASDVVVIPVKPSLYDFRSFENFFDRYEQVKKVKEMGSGKLLAFVLFNEYKERNILSRELREAIEEYELGKLETRIATREAYKITPKAGLGVTEYTDDKAKDEIERLTTELEKIIKDFNLVS